MEQSTQQNNNMQISLWNFSIFGSISFQIPARSYDEASRKMLNICRDSMETFISNNIEGHGQMYPGSNIDYVLMDIVGKFLGIIKNNEYMHSHVEEINNNRIRDMIMTAFRNEIDRQDNEFLFGYRYEIKNN